MSIVNEEWRVIPEYEGYEASSLGNVRSLSRVITLFRGDTMVKRRWQGRVLVPAMHHTGYLVLKLGGGSPLHRVHQLVAWAFIGPQENGMVVNHIDGCKTNNTPENLEYTTNVGNVRHAYDNGLMRNRGEQNGKAILNEEKVRLIRAGMPMAEACEKFGIRKHVFYQVRSGRNWSHVT